MQNLNLTKTQSAKPLPTLQELAQNLRGDCYYFLEPCSAGDTYALCLRKNSFEQKFNGKIIFIIKPSHEPVLRLFGDDDFIVLDEINFGIFQNQQCLKLSYITRHPTFGKILPAHWASLGDDCFNDMLKDVQAKLPTNLPKIDKDLQARLDKIAPLDKIILFCPEANSCPSLPVIIFKDECKSLREQGFFVVVNLAKEQNKYHKHFIEGVYDINLSLTEAIAVGLACAGVVSTRSGFCDIITPHCKNLKIYHTNIFSWEHWKGLCSQEFFIEELPIYKAFLQMQNNLFDKSLPLKLYKRYIAKGFLKRTRTPFTAYFKIYKKHKKAMVKNGVDSGALGLDNSGFDCSVLDNSGFDKEMLDYLAQTYEYQLGLLLEKACKGFWRGGFVRFIFDYLKLRKRKKTLTRLNEILR